MKRFQRLLSTAITLLLPLPAMCFCREPQPRLVCAEYFSSQLVVKATLLSTKTLPDKDDSKFILAYEYTLRVNQSLRGKRTGTVAVHENNDSGRAGFKWDKGGEYLLFLSYEANDNAWELDGCGNSGPVSAARSSLSQISAIKAASGGGFIHGVVIGQTQPTPPAPLPEVRIEAQGSAGRYQATTNAKGEFHLGVPAGRFVVRATQGAFTLEPDTISYEDPRNIEIEPGGCAQVQFSRYEPPLAR
jgi:hypothetical protein